MVSLRTILSKKMPTGSQPEEPFDAMAFAYQQTEWYNNAEGHLDQEDGYELNHSYRHRDYATNVLTFNYTTEPEVTADVAICVPVVEREAAEQNKEFRAHLAHLLIHAVLHAHGYDHVTQEEAEVMEARETELMLSLKFPNPYSDRIGMVHD